jgi:hypothetical protein
LLFRKNWFKIKLLLMGIGDWGLGIGDWGLGIGPNPQSPIPNPQSPSPMRINLINFNNFIFISLNIFIK